VGEKREKECGVTAVSVLVLVRIPACGVGDVWGWEDMEWREVWSK